MRLAAPVKRAVLDALSERDETAAICKDEDGNPEPDSDLRDTENVPLGEDVQKFFEREVKPHVPHAWVNEHVRDERDGAVGVVGYEINFYRYFYRYQPPRKLEDIEADIKAIESDVLKLLKAGGGVSTTTVDTTTIRRWSRYPEYKASEMDWLTQVPRIGGYFLSNGSELLRVERTSLRNRSRPRASIPYMEETGFAGTPRRTPTQGITC